MGHGSERGGLRCADSRVFAGDPREDAIITQEWRQRYRLLTFRRDRPYTVEPIVGSDLAAAARSAPATSAWPDGWTPAPLKLWGDRCFDWLAFCSIFLFPDFPDFSHPFDFSDFSYLPHMYST